MDMNGQLQDPSASPPGVQSTLIIEDEAGWAPVPAVYSGCGSKPRSKEITGIRISACDERPIQQTGLIIIWVDACEMDSSGLGYGQVAVLMKVAMRARNY